MGWAFGENSEGREVGYGVKATCDKEGCDTQIDRGIEYVCGEMHDGGEYGCGQYFCGTHLSMGFGLPEQLCGDCEARFEKEHPEVMAAVQAEADAYADAYDDSSSE